MIVTSQTGLRGPILGTINPPPDSLPSNFLTCSNFVTRSSVPAPNHRHLVLIDRAMCFAVGFHCLFRVDAGGLGASPGSNLHPKADL